MSQVTLKHETSYNLLARIQGRSADLSSPDPYSWFKCGIVTVSKEGKMSIKLHGLPLPNLEWDGWLYVRESFPETGRTQPAVMPPVDPPQKTKRAKSFYKKDDDDVPF